jgi:hypothetical protein
MLIIVSILYIFSQKDNQPEKTSPFAAQYSLYKHIYQ